MHSGFSQTKRRYGETLLNFLSNCFARCFHAQTKLSVDSPDEEVMEEDGPDGLKLRVSSTSATGYHRVVKQRDVYHAKVVIDPWPAPQRTLPGGGCKTARDAAIRLARYEAAGIPLPPKQERRSRGDGKVRTLP